jgi:type IV pilus assembly protein PilB
MSKVNTKTKHAPGKSIDKALVRALMEREELTLEQARDVLTRMKSAENGKTLDNILLEMDIVKEDVLLETKASLWNVPYIDLSNYEIDPEVLELVPGNVVRKYKFFPLFRIDGTLLIAMTDPKDVKAIDKVTELTQLEVSPALSSSQAIEESIKKYYGEDQDIDSGMSSDELQGILEVIEAEEDHEEDMTSTQDLERQAEEAPVVKMTNMVLVQSIMEGASDVHLNPEEDQLRVRFRVDGVLHDAFNLPKNLQEAVISRVKILSNLDIAEHRVPQDGQLRIRLKDGRDIDIRVSTLPSAYGENVVLRILDKSAALLNLENLGYEDDVLNKIFDLLSNAYGIILVTGPTGSGKTTTLYAALNRLSTIEKNVITLEDPIEYRLPLIRQSQVNYKAGMTFAKGLRAILRQDPDIVMVGEIRDTETANIAVQAALTGHLVLSTLHTNSASGAITRLAEMEIEPFLISTSVLGVLAQRLVRKVCSDCKEEYQPEFEIPQSVIDKFNLGEDYSSMKFFKGKGCKRCRDSGYSGRVSIMEVLPVTGKIRELLLKGDSAEQIHKAAVEEGMTPLVEDGWLKVFKGITTLDEVVRVTNIR